MINIKFFVEKKDRKSIVKKLFNGVNRYIKNNFENVEAIKDDYAMEIAGGSKSDSDQDLFVEISIKKRICINKKNIEKKEELDRVVKEIKFLCSKAKEIESYTYLPINFRK